MQVIVWRASVTKELASPRLRTYIVCVHLLRQAQTKSVKLFAPPVCNAPVQLQPAEIVADERRQRKEILQAVYI